ncbi:MAG: guanylate kinase [Burkholderiaceae bacterium]|nr:guanylate kinase [Burkholderiaceae bacterium]
MDYPGNLFAVSAPSGAGKSSLVKALIQADARVRPSVSHTTRAPRGREQEGREYFFVSDRQFDVLVAENRLLEWARVHGNRYGTSRAGIEASLAAGRDVMLEIDWQGALQIRQRFPGAILIFVLPPSLDDLRARLTQRGEDAPEAIALRLQNAERELAQTSQFDYVIINGSFEQALSDLHTIVRARRLRYAVQRRARAETFSALGIG